MSNNLPTSLVNLKKRPIINKRARKAARTATCGRDGKLLGCAQIRARIRIDFFISTASDCLLLHRIGAASILLIRRI
jgi:hypothetical protein